MRITKFGGVICSLLLLIGTANADIIANLGASGGGTWQLFPGTGLNEQGLPNQPYWDDRSVDGPLKNFGYYVTGGSGLPNSPGLTNPQWLGVGNFAASNLIFQSVGANTLTLLLHQTSNVDEFGVFNANNPSQLTPLFLSTTPLGTTLAFTSPYATYGFYLHYLPSANPLIPNDYYKSVTSASVGSESTYLSAQGVAPHQHFAVFAGAGGTSSQNFVIGGEDGWGTNNPITLSGVTTNERSGDYNDFVVSMSAVPQQGNIALPEPATVEFMLAGFCVLLALGSRKTIRIMVRCSSRCPASHAHFASNEAARHFYD